MQKRKGGWRAAGAALLLWGVAVSCRADPLESVAKKLAKGIAPLQGAHVAVLLFPYENGDVSSGSSLVSERLTTLLAQRKHVNIIERSRLAGLLGEMRLEESGVTRSTGAQKPGEILNVDAIVTGTLADDLSGETEVNARVIRLDTGEVLAAAGARIERTWEDRPQAPQVPGENDDDDTSSYVLHASPLIPTPWARSGPRRRAETTLAANVPASESAAVYQEAPAPAVENVAVYEAIPAPPQSRPMNSTAERPRSANSAGQVQALYALGLTLDVQGHHHQAARFYRRLLEETPTPSPIRARAQSRLSRHSIN